MYDLDTFGRCLCGQWHFGGSRAFQQHIVDGRVRPSAIPKYAAYRRAASKEHARKLLELAELLRKG